MEKIALHELEPSPQRGESLTAFETRLRRILESRHMDDTLKSVEYQKLLNELLRERDRNKIKVENFQKKFWEAPKIAGKSYVDNVPAPFRPRAERLLAFIKQKSGEIDWDDVSDNLVLNNKRVPGTNMNSLIGHLVKHTDKNEPPKGFDLFLNTLLRLGVPHNVIGNKKYRTLPAWEKY